VTAELRPAIEQALQDVIGRLEEIGPGDTFDRRVPEAIVAVGLHRLSVPESHGGLGASMGEAALVVARLGAIDGATALGFAMQVHAVGSIADSVGWPVATRDRVYAAIVDGGALVNNAATEEGGGSPARGAVPGTIAVRDADGDRTGWRLTGEKTWTTWLPALRLAFVTARIEGGKGAPAPTSGQPSAAPSAPTPVVGVFLVDLDSPGVERREGFEALGMRGSASGRLVLDGVRVPADALVLRRSADAADPRGPAPGGWFAMAIAATYLGIGEGARVAVARWALDRRPGDGSTAVADVPSVQLRLGRLDATLRIARIVLLDATRRWAETGDPDTRLALVPDLALAKLTATNAAVAATDEALRISGGPGFLAGRLERAFRDARAGLINPPLDDVALTGFGRAVLDRERRP
jgi:alkylation response protein AidB-like acyl-CoA dehydrogenase